VSDPDPFPKRPQRSLGPELYLGDFFRPFGVGFFTPFLVFNSMDPFLGVASFVGAFSSRRSTVPASAPLGRISCSAARLDPHFNVSRAASYSPEPALTFFCAIEHHVFARALVSTWTHGSTCNPAPGVTGYPPFPFPDPARQFFFWTSRKPCSSLL